MSDSRPASAWPTLAILAATIFWGSSFAAMKVTISAFGPWTVMWVRMTVALAVLLPFARRFRPRSPQPGDWKLLLAFVIFQPCLYFALESNALRFTSSAQAGLISASVPLMVALGARIFLGERVSRATVAGLLVALAGVVWLTLAGEPSLSATNPLLGNALEMGAMVTAVGYVLLVRRLSQRYSPWSLTAMQVVAGSLFFLPGAVPLLGGRLGSITPEMAAALVYLGVFVTLGAFGFYNYGIRYIPAGRATAFINLIPVIAVGLGWALLGESLNRWQIMAALLVLAGVWLSQAGRGADLKELHDI